MRCRKHDSAKQCDQQSRTYNTPPLLQALSRHKIRGWSCASQVIHARSFVNTWTGAQFAMLDSIQNPDCALPKGFATAGAELHSNQHTADHSGSMLS